MVRHNPYSHSNLHNSYDFRRKPNYLLWSIVVIVLILIILYILNQNFKTKTNTFLSDIKAKVSEVSSNNSKLINGCPVGIIPEKIELTQDFQKFYTGIFANRLFIVEGSHIIEGSETQQTEQITNSKTNWADGQIIELMDFAERKCHKGQFEDENIDLVYCNDLKYSSSKTPISDEGIIGRTTTISLSIDLVLEKEKVETLIIPPIALGSAREVPIMTYKVLTSECKRR